MKRYHRQTVRFCTAVSLVFLMLGTFMLSGCLIVVESSHDYGYPIGLADGGKPIIGVSIDRVSPVLAAQLGVQADLRDAGDLGVRGLASRLRRCSPVRRDHEDGRQR